MTSSDWTTFNGKQAALGFTPVTDGRTISTSSPLSGGGDLTTNRTISISQATTSTDGYLSSTDWNTFNGKQAALGFTPVTNGRTITINGVTQDLTADRTFSVGSDKGSFGATIDATVTGLVGYITMPYNGTITGWQVIGDVAGNCVLDIWKTASGIIPTVANTIAGSEKPTLASQQINSDLSLSTWTTTITAGDIIGINLDSASTLSEIWLTVFTTKLP